MSERSIKLEMIGKIKGFQTTLSMETNQSSIGDDVKLLVNILGQTGATPLTKDELTPLIDGPLNLLAKELGVDSSTLRPMIGYKEGMVQISKASQLQVVNAMCMLLFAYEKGFSTSTIEFEQFESLVNMNGIKLMYPLPTAIFSFLKKYNYINPKLYEDEKKLSLSPQGETKAISSFKNYIEGKGEKRVPRISRSSRKTKKLHGKTI